MSRNYHLDTVKNPKTGKIGIIKFVNPDTEAPEYHDYDFRDFEDGALPEIPGWKTKSPKKS
jgi:hypothetical protein